MKLNKSSEPAQAGISENPVRLVDTHITDKWGVHWDEMETVRDFLQNFYDANAVQDVKVEWDMKARQVKVSAPKSFDYQALLYLGSDKGEDNHTIGQYGEGFKASLLNAMRNWGCEVEVATMGHHLFFYFEKKKIGETEKQTIMCKISTVPPIKGSSLTISNCTNKILEEFKFGFNYFYHEANPLFDELLAQDGELLIYKSKHPETGYVFYRKLFRAKLDLPIIVVCNRNYAKIDAKINHDRDRKAFNAEVLEMLLKLVFTHFSNYQLKSTVFLLKNWWEKGHKLLALIANTQRRNSSSMNFPENYYAKEVLDIQRTNTLIETNKVIEEFKQAHYLCCPRYMEHFGMQTPDSIAESRIKERQERLNKAYSRDLTLLEKQGITILGHFIKELSKDLYKHFENAQYTVGESDEVLGELKAKRSWRQQHIFLNRIFFTYTFSTALSILLHEWAHIYGSDGSRTFSDALTAFIALILSNENTIIQKIKIYEQDWETTTAKIMKERDINLFEYQLLERIKILPNDQLIKLLSTIPEDELFKLLEANRLI